MGVLSVAALKCQIKDVEATCNSHRRLLLHAKGNSLLQVLSGRRVNDGFVVRGSLGTNYSRVFDSKRFPSYLLTRAYASIEGM